ncbi:DinB superfamily protein [Chryseobacterium oleae]|uniref:DinB superfamily protein n=1 Tax=Chryseobacterium oleae TaxID=491207 RepID=A0A1I5BTJ8_CHROL|nr:DinB family protein [Chryseobacterium oleae]SFN77968.1 DinB superfamily protein [Chryseobacterium oleae]
MKMSTPQLLDELKSLTQTHLKYAENLLQETDEKLNSRMSEGSWSVLECLEHLNRYGDFYIPEINQRISSSKTSPAPVFKPGFLGNYFAKSMQPKDKLNKMKTLKGMDPINSQLDKRVVEKFIRQQSQFLDLLEKAASANLNTIKTSVSISKLIKIKLGDTFRFVIYHNQRHVRQADSILKNL